MTTVATTEATSGADPGVSILENARPEWPITVAVFRRMVDLGVIGEKDRVYLWRGRLARKMAPKRRHSIALKKLYDHLAALVPPGFDVDREQPLALRREASVPEPDAVVLRGSCASFLDDFPTTADVALVVEVAESSLALDREMAATYAGEGVPVYWLVNLPGRRVEVFTEPAEGAYTRCTPYAEADTVPVMLDGVEVGRVAVREILP
jgi:Uma2 family endonuclease